MKNLIVCILFLSSTLYAQDRRLNNSKTTTYLTQGYVLNTINSAGFSKLINHQVNNIGSINPASISQFKNLAFGFSYQFESDINPAWIGNTGYLRDQLAKPQSAAVVFTAYEITYALSFHQRYNSILDFGKIPITTVERPEGTGYTFSPEYTEYIDCYSALVSFPFLIGSKEVNLGISIGINNLNYHEEIQSVGTNTTGYAFSGAIGLTYKLNEKILIGVSYERAPGFNEKTGYDGPDLLRGAQDTIGTRGEQFYILDVEDFKLKTKLPDNLNFALAINLNETYSTVLDLTYIFWKQYSENSNNNLDISSNILANINEELTVSFGFLLTDRDYDGDFDSAFNTNSNLDGFFLLAGANVKLNILDLDFSVASSHLGSGKWREQFIGKFGIGFNF